MRQPQYISNVSSSREARVDLSFIACTACHFAGVCIGKEHEGEYSYIHPALSYQLEDLYNHQLHLIHWTPESLPYFRKVTEDFQEHRRIYVCHG
jgi:hypothetical protein